MKRVLLPIALLLMSSVPLCAETVSSFQDTMQPTTPATGWSYLWNSKGTIGTPANYTSLLPTTDPVYYYDCDGINGVPGPEPGAYVYLGLLPPTDLNAGQPGGHPGPGRDQDSSGIERYAIAAYTLSTGGTVSITNSLLTNANWSADGLDIKVYVNSNSTPLLSASTQGGRGQTTSFDGGLGVLTAGDTIYVAIGSNGSDSADAFSLRYDITAVPEPSTFALLGIGAFGLLAYVWHKRAL
jgi:hypothetical protein